MRRKDREVTDFSKMIDILKSCDCCRLGLVDGNEAYIVPMNFGYDVTADEVTLYFHCAKEGHKIDAIKNYEKASFCVYDSGYRKDGEWALNINSVIIFGKIRLVTDLEITRKICINLVQKFTDDEKYLEKALQNALPRVQCLEFEIEHMTGTLVNES